MIKPTTTKLSSRGQVVIPEEIRKRLGLEEGTRFVVVGEGDVVVLKTIDAPKKSEFAELVEQARAAARDAGLTPEDIEEAILEVRTQK